MISKVLITGFTLLLLGCAKDPNTGKNLPAAKAEVVTLHPNNKIFTIDTSYFSKETAEIKSYYKNKNYSSLWANENDRKTLLLCIAAAKQDGLQPNDYNYDTLTGFEKSKKLSGKESMAYDLLLTQSFYKLALHLFKGKTEANGIYEDWALQQKKLDINLLLEEALNNHTVDKIMDRCRPPHKTYESLRKCLAYLNSLPDDSNLEEIIIEESVKENDSLPQVALIKKRLTYWKDLEVSDSITYIYDSKAIEAVKKFQKRHGFYPDGVVGKKTAEALNISLEERKEQVIVNLERWRWFTHDFGQNAVIINIPDFTLALVNNNDTIATHKVVVGKPDRPTPVLDSKMNYLVINPTWTVPPTILKKDLTPKAKADLNYFAENNMRIFDRENNEVLPEEWNPKLADTYRYVQNPGNSNALGNIKFNYYNRFSVYLHDTNHREMFSMSHRALSSGCIRVQNPLELAEKILSKEDREWNSDKLNEMIAEGETEKIYLKNTNNVHQLYWTAWMDKNGLQFRNDIYNLDKVLYQKLRN